MYGTPGEEYILNESNWITLHRELLERVGAKQIKETTIWFYRRNP
jgi:hypothetical protein